MAGRHTLACAGSNKYATATTSYKTAKRATTRVIHINNTKTNQETLHDTGKRQELNTYIQCIEPKVSKITVERNKMH